MSRCYLSLPGVMSPDDYQPHDTIASAVRTFESWADDCDRFGQYVEDREGCIYLRDERQHDEPKVAADPDWHLSIGPRGAVRRQRC